MRPLLLASSLLIIPSLALADPPQYTLPLAGAASAVTSQPVAARPSLGSAGAGLSAVPVIAADQIARVPALRRIASNGAELLDIGIEHGMRGVFARKGGAFQVFYITPDGQAVIGGVMWSATGKNITRQQVTPIDGAIPTVMIHTVAASSANEPATPDRLAASTIRPASAPVLHAVASAIWGTAGKPEAPKLWVFIDPLCGFSTRAMGQLQGYVAAGRVQLAVIPISVLDYEDQGRSTTAAKAMLGMAPNAMVEAWRQNKMNGPAEPAADARLAANMAAAAAIGLRGTPTFLWRRADGTEGRSDGLPDQLDALIASLGS
jgi:thiol:disulfide interchange protein DsbG